MSSRCRCLIVLLVAGSVLSQVRSSPAQGQRRPLPYNPLQQRPLQPQPTAAPVTFSGTLQDMKGGLLEVASASQGPFLVKIDPRHTKVKCTGTAEKEFLRPGLYVRFSGDFDNRGAAKGELAELAIVSLSETVRQGVVQNSPAGLAEPPKKKVKYEGGNYLVIGQIKGVKNDQLEVTVPGVPSGLKVSLAETAKINVEADDVSLVQQGDEIEVKGNLVQPGQNGQPGQVVAGDVTIKLAKPLSAQSKKKPSKFLAVPRGKKSDKGADAAPPGNAP